MHPAARPLFPADLRKPTEILIEVLDAAIASLDRMDHLANRMGKMPARMHRFLGNGGAL